MGMDAMSWSRPISFMSDSFSLFYPALFLSLVQSPFFLLSSPFSFSYPTHDWILCVRHAAKQPPKCGFVSFITQKKNARFSILKGEIGRKKVRNVRQPQPLASLERKV